MQRLFRSRDKTTNVSLIFVLVRVSEWWQRSEARKRNEKRENFKRLYSVSFCVSFDSRFTCVFFALCVSIYTLAASRRLPRRRPVKLVRAPPRRCADGGGGVLRQTRTRRTQTFSIGVEIRRRRTIQHAYCMYITNTFNCTCTRLCTKTVNG